LLIPPVITMNRIPINFWSVLLAISIAQNQSRLALLGSEEAGAWTPAANGQSARACAPEQK